MKKRWTRRDFLSESAKASLALALLASGCGHLIQTARNPASVADDDEDEFDYIVIGSGAGGGPVAANLAKAGFSVLLLEAGGILENDTLVDTDFRDASSAEKAAMRADIKNAGRDYETPIFHGRSTENRAMAWEFFVRHYSDDNLQRRDSKHREDKGGIFYPRAGTVGGCTAHNAMITLYPANEDWDNLASATSDPSWNSLEMRRYFTRLEEAKYRTESRNNQSQTGYHGWLSVDQIPLELLKNDRQLQKMVEKAFLKGGARHQTVLNLIDWTSNLTLDPNDARFVQANGGGVARMPAATNKGRRNGTRELIFDTVDKCKSGVYKGNLNLRSFSFATNLVFSDKPNQTDRVIGVQYKQNPNRFMYKASPLASEAAVGSARNRVAKARKEVVLAGGAFNTPQLLMLSGIGDPAQLGLGTRIQLPGVGRNLQDRYEVGVVTEMPRNFDLIDKCKLGEEVDPCMDDYKTKLAKSAYGTNGVVLSLIEKSDPKKSTPDLVLFGVPGHFRGYYPGWAKDSFVKDRFTWAVLKGHTVNTAGTVKLNSKDPKNPFQMPEINFKYFGDGKDQADQDLEGVLQGVKHARNITASIMKDEAVPGKAVQTDDQIRQYIRRESWGHHASCTSKMGPDTDAMAVVDSKFRVHKTKGLRIVDASVFPRIPGLFIVTPIYMVAEKASDDILNDAQYADNRKYF